MAAIANFFTFSFISCSFYIISFRLTSRRSCSLRRHCSFRRSCWNLLHCSCFCLSFLCCSCFCCSCFCWCCLSLCCSCFCPDCSCRSPMSVPRLRCFCGNLQRNCRMAFELYRSRRLYSCLCSCVQELYLLWSRMFCQRRRSCRLPLYPAVRLWLCGSPCWLRSFRSVSVLCW